MPHENVDDKRSEGSVADDGSLIAPDASSRAVMIGGKIDVSLLPLDQQQELLREYTRGMMDLEKKSAEIGIDVGALEKQLQTLVSSAAEANAGDVSVTYTHVTESNAGRTEVVVGNTKEAERGRLPKSQTGQIDWNPIFVITAIIAVVIVIVVAIINSGTGG